MGSMLGWQTHRVLSGAADSLAPVSKIPNLRNDEEEIYSCSIDISVRLERHLHWA